MDPESVVGIVLGVTAVVLLIFGAVYLICLRKNRYTKEVRDDGDEKPGEVNEIYV